MKIEFFGWLTKGRMNVSLMDEVVLVCELLIILLIVYYAILGYEKMYKIFYKYDFAKRKWVRK